MTNRDIIARAIANGVVEKDLLLTRVLSGAAAPRPVKATGQWKSAAGWLCSACMICLILIGYFNGNITLRTQGEGETTLVGTAAVEQGATGGSLPHPKQSLAPAAVPPKMDAEIDLQEEEASAAPVVQVTAPQNVLEQDGWVRTNQEVNAEDKPYEPKYETYTGDSGSSSYYVATPKPDDPKPKPPLEEEGPSNPDTGGSNSDYIEVPYLRFVADAEYSAYWGYIPSNLISFSVLPLVGYTPSNDRELGSVSINYGNPNGDVKQVFAVTVQGAPAGEPLVTVAAQITPMLLKTLNGSPLQKDPSLNLYINISLNVQNRSVNFESQNISYEQAAQVLQSLPALNGRVAP